MTTNDLKLMERYFSEFKMFQPGLPPDHLRCIDTLLEFVKRSFESENLEVASE